MKYTFNFSKKFIYLLFSPAIIVIFFSLFMADSSKAQTHPWGRDICRNSPVFFEHDNFNGTALPLHNSYLELTKFNFNDKASSVCVPRNWRVVLYEHKDCRGARFRITGQKYYNDLKRNFRGRSNWGDRISSVEVFKKNPRSNRFELQPWI